MRITLTIDENSLIFFQLRDMWEKAAYSTKETFKDYLKDYILETSFHADKLLDEAGDYVSANIGSIVAKHPEAAFLLMDYMDGEEDETIVID